MKSLNYKNEFSIFVYDENPVQARYLKEVLARQGYDVQFFTSEDLLLQAIYLALPHIVILPSMDKTFSLAESVQKVSREIQIFAVGPTAESERLHRLLELKKIYDYILDPVVLPAQFLHRIERGVESWMAAMLQEEFKKDKIVPVSEKTEEIRALDFIEPAVADAPAPAPVQDRTLADLLLCQSEEIAIQFALKQLQSRLGMDVLYLKYDLQNEVLALMDVATGLRPQHRQLGLKLDLIQDVSHFFSQPHDYKIWSDFMRRVFNAEQNTVRVVRNKEIVLGLLVALGSVDEAHQQILTDFCGALSVIVDNHMKSRLLFDHLPLELKTFCLNNKNFYERLSAEVSRGRRHHNQISVLSFEVRSKNAAEQQKAMTLLAKVAQRFTRASDFVGRLADNRLAITLPQTSQDNATFVASRLTRIVQKAFEEKFLKDSHLVCGVNAFPELANDAMSLLLGSEEAAQQAQPFEVVVYTVESTSTLDL